MDQSSTKILILGAGFGGVSAAQELAKKLPAEDRSEIILVDRNNYLLFTPLLTEVAGGYIDSEDVAVPVRRLSHHIHFVQGDVIHTDLHEKRVTIQVGSEPGVPESTRTLSADHIVFALGSETNFHGIKGLEEHSLTIKSIKEASAIRSKALALIERAAVEQDADTRRALLTFVVAGGGFSGVETMASLNDLVRESAKNHPALSERDVRTVLVHPGERLLPELNEGLAGYAERALEKRGVQVLLKTEVKGASDDCIQIDPSIKEEDEIPAYLLVWAAGVKPSPIVEQSGAELGKQKGLVVNHCCQVSGHEMIWALGDCAEVPQGSGKTYGPTAQNATREGRLVGRNIAAVMKGERPQPFAYRPVGELAIVGKRRGVASLYGLHISGVVAWLMWRAVYLAKMPTMVKRLRVGASWLADAAFGRDAVELTWSAW